MCFTACLKRQIVAGFRELAATYLNSDYHPTYLQRRLGPKGFLELDGDRYRLRASLLVDLTCSELEDLLLELIESLKSAAEHRQEVMKTFQDATSLPKDHLEERRRIVDAYLSNASGNRGELFEVVSFAVLREYFHSFGFSLQRFSTTFANDGGMDFVGGDAIYQVSVDESLTKFQRDLRKAPGTKRVLVRPTVSNELVENAGTDVLCAIELRDILTHFVAWLFEKDSRFRRCEHLQAVLKTALEEFRREQKAEGV